VFAGVGTGVAVAGGACLILMHAGAASTRAWLVLGALCLLATALIWREIGGDDVGGHRDGTMPPTPAGHRWDRESVRLVLCYGAFGFGYIIPATFLPAMARAMVPDPMIFGWSWPVFGAAAAVSTLAVAQAASALGNRRLWRLGQTVMAVGIAVPVVVPGMVAIMLAALVVGSTFMVITMTGLQESRHVAGPEATPLMAAMTAAFAAGQIVGPLVVSYLVGVEADFSRPLMVAVVALLAGALALANRPGDLYNSAR
jgi:MFS family permease